MDHLVMFVHPNEEVVPLFKHHNQQHVTTNHMSPTNHHHPCLMMATGLNKHKTGPNDASHHLGPDKFSFIIIFLSLTNSFILNL